MSPRNVLKRNGNTVSFSEDKIKRAVSKAAISVNKELQQEQIDAVTAYVVSQTEPGTTIPIKKIQDLVEEGLMNIGEYQIAKSYILFRNEKDSKRDTIGAKAASLKKKLAEDHKVFEGDKLREFVYLRTYSRWLDKEGRRETWVETVKRYMDFMKSELGDKLTTEEYSEIEQAIKNMEVLPSMRLLWSSGEAAKKNNVAAYNCSYMGITCPEDLADLVFLLMSGTGVGVSVEKQFTDQFPEVHPLAEHQPHPNEPYFVDDSKEGWAEAQRINISNALVGRKMIFDFSKVRPAGARLKLSGGRSSGPDPLKDLLSYTYNKIHSRRAEGRLRPIDIYDIVCKTAEIVLCGGTRRSAIICIFDKDDHEMMNAKQGQFWTHSPHRSLSNNSVVFNDTPSNQELIKFWETMLEGGTGEPGLLNREGLIHNLTKRRNDILSVSYRKQMGWNPCAEVQLQSHGLCNLTTVITRPEDSIQTLKTKLRLAAILGTFQSTLSNFTYISTKWKQIEEQERLLGVSISGICDNHITTNPTKACLADFKDTVVATNIEYANRFGITCATATTCIKPEGTTSQLANCSSGISTRYSPYYIRRVRITANDPLLLMLKDQGVPCHPEVGQREGSASTYCLEFPVKAPETTTHFVTNTSTKEQLQLVNLYKTAYTEHSVSATIHINKNEWIKTLAWVEENWDDIGGLAFLPKDDNVYQLAPYEEITKEEYEQRAEMLKNIDFSKLPYYEFEDNTTGAKSYACQGGHCEI